MEIDKSKSIRQMTLKELRILNNRLRREREVQIHLRQLLANAGTNWDYENPPQIDTVTPVGRIYPMSGDWDNKSISELTMAELNQLIESLRQQLEVHDIIYDLKRSSGERWDWEDKPIIDNATPINELYHYGILGMKWGVRKDRNQTKSTGSKSRGGTSKKSEVPKAEDFLESRQFKKKAVAGLSNAELKKLNDRLNLEKQYKDLTKKEIRKGQSFVTDSLYTGLKQTATTAVAAGSLYAVKKLIEKKYGQKTVLDMFPTKKK